MSSDSSIRRYSGVFPDNFFTARQDDWHAFSAPVHNVRAMGREFVSVYRAVCEQAGNCFIAAGLPIRQALRRHRIQKRSRRVELQPIIEQPQAYFAACHRVIAIRHGVGDRLEDGEHVVLG